MDQRVRIYSAWMTFIENRIRYERFIGTDEIFSRSGECQSITQTVFDRVFIGHDCDCAPVKRTQCSFIFENFRYYVTFFLWSLITFHRVECVVCIIFFFLAKPYYALKPFEDTAAYFFKWRLLTAAIYFLFFYNTTQKLFAMDTSIVYCRRFVERTW